MRGVRATHRFGLRGDGRRFFSAAIALGVAAMTAPAVASAVPGQPGTPSPPIPVFSEDFETGMGTTPILLTSYTGAPPQNETYTADPVWVSGPLCNGIITSQLSSDFPGCGFNAQIRGLANQLGVFAGDPTPADNHAVSAFTAGDPGAGQIQFETVQPIGTGGPNRFITFSVDAAATNCFAADPLLAFFLLSGGNEIPAFSDPINPCTAAGEVGRFIANQPFLLPSSSVGVRMRNQQASGTGNDGAFDNIQILDATPQLDKSFGAAVVEGGDPVALTFTVTNSTDLLAKPGWSFTDTLPAGMTVASPNDATTDCPGGSIAAPAGGGTIAVSGNLNGGQVACAITVNVTATGGLFENGPDNVSQAGLLPPGTAEVRFIPADMVGTKAPVAPFVRGTQGQYRIVATNAGAGATTATVTVTDTLPAGLTPVAAAGTGWSCAISSQTVSCSRDDALGAGASYEPIEITVDVALDAPASVTNTASISCPFPCDQGPPGEATSTDPVVSQVDLSVAKTADPDSILATQQSTFTMVVRNAGPSIAEDVVLDDPLPAGLIALSATPSQGTCAAAPTPYNCALGSLQPGAQATVEIVVEAENTPPPAETTLTNTATVSSSTTETAPGDNVDSADLEVRTGSDLAIVKSAPATVNAEQDLKYTLAVSNAGPSASPSTIVEDPLPAGMQFLSATTPQGSCSAAGSTVTCALGTLSSGQSLTIEVLVRPAEELGGARPRNTATVRGANADIAPENNSSSVEVGVLAPLPDLRVSKSRTAGIMRSGERVTFTIVVANAGNGPATNAVVTDRLPGGLRFVSGRSTAGTCTGRQEFICRVGTIAARAVVRITIVAEVRTTGSLINTAVVTAAERDLNPLDNRADLRSDATGRVVPVLRKRAGVRSARRGQSIPYTITMRNPGAGSLRGVRVCDVLPAGLTYLPGTARPAATLRSGQLCWRVNSLAEGASRTFRLRARADVDVRSGRLTNQVVASGPGMLVRRARATVGLSGAIPARGKGVTG